MNLALAVILWAGVPAQVGEPQAAKKPTEPTRYWYGNPLKEGTRIEVQDDYPRAVLATLDANERAALEKLKALGFTVPNKFDHFKFVMKDGKRIVTPPRGISLGSPRVSGPKRPMLTPKDLEPLGDLRHVVSLSLGGKFVDDDTLDLLRNMDELRNLSITYSRITDGGLKKLVRFKILRGLTLDGNNITDAGAATLAKFPALEAITLEQTRVTDAGMASLAKSATLWALCVTGTLPGDLAVGDAGLNSLADMPKLKDLALRMGRVTDKGLAEMAKPGNFSGLGRFDVTGTAVTDAGLKNFHDLKALPALKVLDLTRTQVTPDGVVALQKARPDLRVTAAYPNGTPFESTVPPRKE